jgi:hypothetical protein
MSDEEDRSKRRPYKVGYKKPPKQHQFKPKGGDAAGASKRKRRRNGKAPDKEQVDLANLFAQPVVVTKGGRVEKMDAAEVALRKQLERAIKDGYLPAIKAVLEAIAWDLLKKPAPAPGGGVLLVPIRTAEDLERYNATFFPAEDVAADKSEHGDE